MDKYITCPADIIAANGSVCITACIYYSMQCWSYSISFQLLYKNVLIEKYI